MNTRDRLQIVLITYNRAKYLHLTFDQILGAGSPIRDFDITVLDNNSTDETRSIVGQEQLKHPNLKYIKNNFNIGGNANIAKAFEMARNDYLWVLCDDDKYDWTAWPEIEAFIAKDNKLIAASNFDVKPEHRSDATYLLGQLTFLPSVILNKCLLSDAILRNVYDSTPFLFPHLAPVITHLNKGGEIAIVSHSIVNPGRYGNDISFTRGSPRDDIFLRGRTMTFLAGFAYLCRNLNDQKLARRCLHVRIDGDYLQRIGYGQFYRNIFFHTDHSAGKIDFTDIYALLPFFRRMTVRLVYALSQTCLPSLLFHSPLYTLSQKIVDAINHRHATRSTRP